MAIQNFQRLQKDPIELERCQKDPVYFYNMYVRLEGEKVLTAEEYEKMAKERTNSTMMLNQLTKSAAEYPLTDKDATTGT